MFEFENCPQGWRPFVCNGAPGKCKAFLVGINPATPFNDAPFSTYYGDGSFDKGRWLHDYIEERGTLGKTRIRIEALVDSAAPVKVLETNVWAYEAGKPRRVRREHRVVSPFVELLGQIKPQAILFHGRAIHFARKSSDYRALAEILDLSVFPRSMAEQVALGWQQIKAQKWNKVVCVRVIPHLCMVSPDDAPGYGAELRRAVEAG